MEESYIGGIHHTVDRAWKKHVLHPSHSEVAHKVKRDEHFRMAALQPEADEQKHLPTAPLVEAGAKVLHFDDERFHIESPFRFVDEQRSRSKVTDTLRAEMDVISIRKRSFK